MNRQHRRAVLVIALSAVAGSAQAQVFKCTVAGRQVYQQHACEQTGASGQKMSNLNEAGAGSGGGSTLRKWVDIPDSVAQSGKELCLAAVPSAADWKDRDSVKIGSIVRMGASTTSVAGKRVPVHTYGLMLNGKNSYGAYAGEQMYFCNVDVQEKVFLSYGL